MNLCRCLILTVLAPAVLVSGCGGQDGSDGARAGSLVGAGPGGVGAVGFQSVKIASLPKGGSAYKTAYPDGRMEGGHLSGSPESPMVHRSTGWMSAADLEALNALVARVLAARDPQPTGPEVDQREDCVRVTITLGPNDAKEYVAAWGKKFASPDVQAICDLLQKQQVGAW